MDTCDFCDQPLPTKRTAASKKRPPFTRRFCNATCKLRHSFRAVGTTKARKAVASVFQAMIRAEHAAQPPGETMVVSSDGKLQAVFRTVGQCVCVTCGATHRWNAGIRYLHTGHFIGGRRASILFEETNVAPQCYVCNVHKHGNAVAYTTWMRHKHGDDEIARLQALNARGDAVDREQLIEKMFEYKARLKTAKKKLET